MHPHRSWLGTALGVFLWPALLGLGGFVAAVNGGHASGIFILIGALVGASGACFHFALHFVRRLRRPTWLGQTLTAWCGTMGLSAALTTVQAVASGDAADAGGRVGFVLLLAGLPALLAAGLITWVVASLPTPPLTPTDV